jgi:hypothetical protein
MKIMIHFEIPLQRTGFQPITEGDIMWLDYKAGQLWAANIKVTNIDREEVYISYHNVNLTGLDYSLHFIPS